MKFIRLIALLYLVFYLVGCAFNKPRGEIYSGTPDTAPGSSKLVLYRPYGESVGYDRVYALEMTGGHYFNMLHGGYSVLEAKSGPFKLNTYPRFTIRAWLPCLLVLPAPFVIYAELFADNTTSLSFDLKPGDLKFVRFRPSTYSLELVPTELAEEELKKCRAQ